MSKFKVIKAMLFILTGRIDLSIVYIEPALQLMSLHEAWNMISQFLAEIILAEVASGKCVSRLRLQPSSAFLHSPASSPARANGVTASSMHLTPHNGNIM